MLRGTTSFDVLCVKIGSGPRLWSVGRTENKKPSKHFGCAISRIRGIETLWGIVTKFFLWADIQESRLFADDRLRGLGVATGRISHFPIDLCRRPYNTRTVASPASVSASFSNDAAKLSLIRCAHCIKSYWHGRVRLPECRTWSKYSGKLCQCYAETIY